MEQATSIAVAGLVVTNLVTIVLALLELREARRARERSSSITTSAVRIGAWHMRRQCHQSVHK
jgi:hypothetical protein